MTKARITLFAEKMKFAEFFSGKGDAFERGKIKTCPLSSAYADTFPATVGFFALFSLRRKSEKGESKSYSEIKESLFLVLL